MNRLFLTIVFGFMFVGSITNTVLFAQAITKNDPRVNYLERKLSFNYYNTTQGMWWINTFKYNPEDQTFRFKSISTENPAKIFDKKYTDRIFSLSDLNPYLITISRIEQNQGYMVKGDLLRIETVKHQNLVRKNINTIAATPQSYIHFVIPDYLKDSTQSIVDSLRLAFESLIVEATTLYRVEDSIMNTKTIMEALTGQFEYGDIKRFADRRSEHEISYEDYQDRNRIQSGVFRYNPSSGHYYEKIVSNGGIIEEIDYELDKKEQVLVLVSVSGPERKIVFENKSKIIQLSAEKIELRPSGSY